MSDLRRERGPGRRQSERLSGHHRAIGIRSGRRVVLDRRRRSSPLPVDSPAVFINEHRHIAFPRVELGEIVRTPPCSHFSTGPRRCGGRARASVDCRWRRRVRRSNERANSRPFSDGGSSRWHVASAPARPPRLPVTLVALVMKKLMPVVELVVVEVVESSSPQPAARIENDSTHARVIFTPPERMPSMLAKAEQECQPYHDVRQLVGGRRPPPATDDAADIRIRVPRLGTSALRTTLRRARAGRGAWVVNLARRWAIRVSSTNRSILSVENANSLVLSHAQHDV